MKNVDKIIKALRETFPGHAVEYQYKPINCVYSIFIDRVYIGSFEQHFCEADFDNPKIEIKIKANVHDLEDFLYECEGSGGVAVVMREVERGLEKWREESQANN